ncbi:MAG TPA: GNAT family protein [Gaiellaceae bacterium]|nr:GNAT family protein [Gaiellaceae bacterium]
MIRPLTPDDPDELAALLTANRAFLAPYEPKRPDEFFTPAGQRERLAHLHEDSRLFAILDGDAIAGTISLTNIVRGALQSANAGYWVAEDRNGRGLATAAVGELLAFAFGEAGLHRVEAGTLVDNLASQRVLERNGFERIGLAARYLLIAGEWRDHLLFQRVADGPVRATADRRRRRR